MSLASTQVFEISLSKSDFRFAAAHFTSHDGGRERLHGHNYQVSVVLRGRAAAPGDAGAGDGKLVDFGEAKRAVRSACAELHERFLCPLRSRDVAASVARGQLELRVAADASFFSLPLRDCALLPLANSTVEELSVHLALRVAALVGLERLRERRVDSLALAVAETPGQEARFRLELNGPDTAAMLLAHAADLREIQNSHGAD